MVDRLTGTHVTRDRIVGDLRTLGLRNGDTVFVHSSMSRVGYVLGGADTVIDGILEIVGDRGTVIMPAFTMDKSMKDTLESGFLFDPNLSRTTMGIIPETFRKRDGVYRSLHPTHSVCAYGMLASWITEGHETCETTFGVGTPFHKLWQIDGRILGIGVDLSPVTFYHVIEDIRKDFPVRVYDGIGYTAKLFNHSHNILQVTVRAHDPDVAKTRIEKNQWVRNFSEEYFRSRGVLTEGRIGKARSWIANARDLYEAQCDLLANGLTIYTTKEQYLTSTAGTRLGSG